jgi:hypothetical protein
MKRRIGLHATTFVAPSKKRGFYSALAAHAAGHIHVPGLHSKSVAAALARQLFRSMGN